MTTRDISTVKDSSLDAIILADIAVILFVGVAVSPLRARLRQPVVVGEIAAGLLLGPSVLGLLPGDLPALLFPPAVRPHLSTIAQVGIVLFMFIAGWELDFHPLRGRLRSVFTITTVSLAIPFTLAVAVATVLITQHPAVTSPDTPTAVFPLFMGIVLSISALSVLVRIIKENGLHSSRSARWPRPAAPSPKPSPGALSSHCSPQPTKAASRTVYGLCCKSCSTPSSWHARCAPCCTGSCTVTDRPDTRCCSFW
ncbi:cation:proton antiporter [Streptomyces sp. AV19]|nr:cation:proton antiporter [Streptomyces sp. AV19]